MKGATASGIAFDVRGSGDPILLVRPLGGSIELWGSFRTELAKSLRVIAFDARGTGRSAGRARTSIEAMADDATSVLDALGVARAHVLGLSLGGIVAIDLAARPLSRVRKLVLASTPARFTGLLRAGARGASLAACLVKRSPALDECLVERLLPSTFETEHPREMRWIRKTLRRHPASRATIMRHVAAAVRANVRSKVAKIRAPTLVVVGARDRLLGPNAGVALTRAIAGATRERIADAGHAIDLEQPIAFARLVTRFVSA